MNAALPLRGRGIVITRPARQAAVLAAVIRELGGRPILFPVIDIVDIDDTGQLDAIIARLHDFDLAIFVSPNAVDKGCEAILARRTMPTGLAVGAIGRGSARALRKAGFEKVLAPASGADSESLLALPELQDVKGQRIVVFRGAGGRELLFESFSERGARVEYAECYRRMRPKADPTVLTSAWARNEIDAVVVTSSEGLRNLHALLHAADRERLAATPLFMPHPRIAATARELGLNDANITGPGDEGIVEALTRYFESMP